MKNRRIIKDMLFRKFSAGISIFSILLVCAIGIGLYMKAWPVLEKTPLFEIVRSGEWHPVRGGFGLLPFISGTIWVTLIAMVIAVPVSILSALYITEYAPAAFGNIMKPMIDLLAGIPSVIYGVWGIIVVVPFVKNVAAPFFNVVSTGYTALTAGIVLAIMVLPVIIHVLIEVFRAVPEGLRNAALSLGATGWQTVKHVVLRRSIRGIIAGVVLGFSRAFGETMAVLMVAGNVVMSPRSPLDPAYPLPALIANNYGEMMSIPLYDAALMTAALILFIVVVGFNLLSRYVLLIFRVRGG